jgi:hypothetical protein
MPYRKPYDSLDMPTGAQEVTKNSSSKNNNPINILFVFIYIKLIMFLPSEIHAKYKQWKFLKINLFQFLIKVGTILLKSVTQL